MKEHLAGSQPIAEVDAETAGTEEKLVDARRRKALVKLGIASGVIYAAPTVLRIDRNLAHAMGSTCNAGGGNGSEQPGSDCDPGNSGGGPAGGNDG